MLLLSSLKNLLSDSYDPTQEAKLCFRVAACVSKTRSKCREATAGKQQLWITRPS
jgi:hypothetical protein